MTILVSSHILSEIEKLVTHVGIIHRGALTVPGHAEARWSPGNRSHRLPRSIPTTIIGRSPSWRVPARTARLDRGKVVLRPLPPAEAGRVTAILVAGGLAVHEITTVRKDLESIFLDLIATA